jgi:1,4-dihydroxy-2-naphthoate octaprenyltransferase
MVFFGLVAVCCTAALQVGSIPLASVPAAVGIGSLATAILVVNNVRDASTDVRVGKRTLVVRFGHRFGLAEYAVLVTMAFAVPPVLLWGFGYSIHVLLGLLPAPLGVALVSGLVRASDGPTHNTLLGRTAALLLIYSVLLSAGIVLGAP